MEVKAAANLPAFHFFVVFFVRILIVFVGVRVLVKLFILQDFVVFVVQKEIHGSQGLAAGGGVGGGAAGAAATVAGGGAAAGAAPGCDGYVVQ